MKQLFLITLFASLAFSCKTTPDGDRKNEVAAPAVQETTDEKQASPDSRQGQAVYRQFCLTCHQVDGSGVPGMHPPLTGTPYVLGDPEELIQIVLNGLQGEMEVLGETYNQIMPAQDFLTDRQIADVLSYIRGSFGNEAPAITPDEVRKVRKAAGK